jgi:hypothetical protein
MLKICKNCKTRILLQDSSMQTEDSFNPYLPPIQNLHSDINISLKSHPFIKPRASLGDLDVPGTESLFGCEENDENIENPENFEDLEIYENIENSFILPQFQRTLLTDDTIQAGFHFRKDELSESTRVQNYFRKVFIRTPELMSNEEKFFGFKSKTPNLASEDVLGDSYEKIFESFDWGESAGLRESFKKLVMIEKKTVQEGLMRNVRKFKF